MSRKRITRVSLLLIIFKNKQSNKMKKLAFQSVLAVCRWVHIYTDVFIEDEIEMLWAIVNIIVCVEAKHLSTLLFIEGIINPSNNILAMIPSWLIISRKRILAFPVWKDWGKNDSIIPLALKMPIFRQTLKSPNI